MFQLWSALAFPFQPCLIFSVISVISPLVPDFFASACEHQCRARKTSSGEVEFPSPTSKFTVHFRGFVDLLKLPDNIGRVHFRPRGGVAPMTTLCESGEIAVPVIQRHPATAIIFVGSQLTLVFGVLNLIAPQRWTWPDLTRRGVFKV